MEDKVKPNYVTYHLHSDLSLLDSTTKFEDYIIKAVELEQKAICFTEHGNIMRWVAKKEACDKAGIKYIHGCEVYLTNQLSPKVRDNYHTILIAKNMEGLKEVNDLISMSNTESHFYFKPRITFEEFLNISDNVIKISACLASPLARMETDMSELSKKIEGFDKELQKTAKDIDKILDGSKCNFDTLVDDENYKSTINSLELSKKDNDFIINNIELCRNKQSEKNDCQSRLSNLEKYYSKMLVHYDYYEIQPHVNSDDQKKYNKKLFELSKKNNIPLIAGTDTHSLNKYKAECRSILQLAKGIEFTNEDQFDLTYKSYDELVAMFEEQDTLPKRVYLEAIENTNIMADSCEEVVLDKSFKYPKVYEDDVDTLKHRLWDMLLDKIKRGVIDEADKELFISNIKEELAVFQKIDMCGFMLFMSDLIIWCHDNDIPTGPARGSCGGSCIAYVLDIIDLNPLKWKTVFSRFANENRKEIGDIDVDFAPNDRETVYNHMIEKFGDKYTAYILAIGTVSDKGCIDEIGRALHRKFPDNDLYTLESIKQVKKDYEHDADKAKEKYKELFYYFDGLLNTNISQSMHPCGMVVSPITLDDNYGTLYRDGKKILQIDMEDVHEISLVKYDILGLKNVEIIKDACEDAHIDYPKAHEVNWDDKNVWDDMLKCPQGIFQFEGEYAFQMLCQFKPQSMFDMSLVTAALRPGGASYRDSLMQKDIHHNISPMIDEMLKDNYGYLVYQEDVLKFLQEICGLSGSEADNVRRAIARKQMDRLEAALPAIQDGYVEKSGKPREEAVNELQEYIQILIDSSSYMFGYNHSIAYCMVGYLCAYLRYYHTPYFIVSYLNNAANEDDIVGGFEMAKLYGYHILPPRFRHSTSKYVYDEENHNIYKGVASIKFLNEGAAEYLYSLRHETYPTFVSLLERIEQDSMINSRQMEILIQLQYFEEFGKNKKLLTVYRRFKEIYGRKMLTKDKLTDLNLTVEDIVDAYEKETEKQYVNIDSALILSRLENNTPNENIPLSEQILFEADVVGYLSATYDVDKRYCYVMELDTKYSPRVTLYSLGTGKQVICKINKEVFKDKPFKKQQILLCNRFFEKYKQRKTDKGWERTNEKEWWLGDYEVIAKLDL